MIYRKPFWRKFGESGCSDGEEDAEKSTVSGSNNEADITSTSNSISGDGFHDVISSSSGHISSSDYSGCDSGGGGGVYGDSLSLDERTA